MKWHILLIFTIVFTEDLQNAFANYVHQYDKHYNSPEEYEFRFNLFKQTISYVTNENKKLTLFSLGVNMFADMTQEEKQMHYMKEPIITKPKSFIGYHKPINGPIQAYPNWAAFATPAKNQQRCGDCYAFGAVGTLESLYAIKNSVNGDDIPLFSEQELTDCGIMYGSRGCNGGFHHVYDYVAQYGIHTALNYGMFLGYQSQCKILPNSDFQIKGIVEVKPYNNDLLLNALNLRPLWVAVDSTSNDFLNYQKGIFNGACGTIPYHIMLLVGAGIENGVEYWVLKNSWGSGWGENGFMRIIKDKGIGMGKCGLNLYAAYPVTSDDTIDIEEVKE